ncbi:MAG: hypothetical protein Rubg2KO_32910 [Rubricoccaceae bacterium]
MLRPLLLLACLAIAAPVAAQNCTNALQRAETSYQSGEFDNTIDRLTTCLDANRFTSAEDRRNAYRLIGLSYIGKDREADARAAVASLLDVAPNYEADPAIDPPPFVRMVSEMRRRRPGSTLPGTGVASTRQGFNASFRAHGMSYSDDDVQESSFSGAGGDLTLGYNFTPSISAYANLAGSTGSGETLDLSLGSFGLGGRFHINGGNAKLVPFVGAGVASQAASFSASSGSTSVSNDFSGVGGSVEGGLLYFFSPTLALDTGITAAFGTISNDPGLGGNQVDLSATIVRVAVGLSWRP